MPIIAKEENPGEPIPTGMQQAVCSMVCDIGTQRGQYQGKPSERRQAVIIWELAEKKTLGNYAGQPFQTSKFYTLSLSEKAKLRADLQSWRGRPFTEDELKGFDLEKLVGANCFLNIVPDENGKPKINAITPLAKGMEKILPTMKTEPEWVAKKRAESIEAKGIPPSGNGAVGAHDAPPHTEDDLPF